MNIQFGVGNDGTVGHRDLDGCGVVRLADIESACATLGLTLESVSKPDTVVGKSPHQWYIDVRLDGERVHYMGDSEPGSLDYRDVDYGGNA